MANNSYNSRTTSLNKGKIKPLGLFETLKMKIIGWLDGRRGLPREERNGWYSPQIDREIHAYEEFCSRMWGILQIESEDAYSRIGNMIDSIYQTEKSLGEAKRNLQIAIQREDSMGVERKNGEEKLTDGQVKTRRDNERKIRLSSAKSRVASLENSYIFAFNELLSIRNEIRERENSTRMICNRVKEHSLERIDVYWNSALRKHPEKQSMPVLPYVEFRLDAKQKYMDFHKLLIEKTEILLSVNEKDSLQEVI